MVGGIILPRRLSQGGTPIRVPRLGTELKLQAVSGGWPSEVVTVTPLPPPTEIPWTLVKAECVNVQNPNWQVMVQNVPVPTEIVLKGWWFNHVPTTLLSGQNEPIEIRNQNGQVVRAFNHDELPFVIKSGESAYFKILDINYSDNDIPWAFNTRPGYPPLRFLVRQRVAAAPLSMPQSPLCITP